MKLEVSRDNHFIQAAWVGNLFSSDINENKRKRKVYCFLLKRIFNDYENWPEFIMLDKYIKEIAAEDAFLSKNKIIDNLDDLFAKDAENKLSNVISLVNDFNNFKQIKDIDIFNLKRYMALNIARTSNSLINTILKLDKKEFNEFKLLKEDIDILNTQDSNIKLKGIANLEIKNNYDDLINCLDNLSYTRLFSYINNAKITHKNSFVTQNPYVYNLNNELDKETIQTFTMLFFNFIYSKNSEEINILKHYYGENFEESRNFLKDFFNVVNNFVAGPLSKDVFCFITLEESPLAYVFSRWFFIDNKAYTHFKIQADPSELISSNKETLISLYNEVIVKIPFYELREKYNYLSEILNNYKKK